MCYSLRAVAVWSYCQHWFAYGDSIFVLSLGLLAAGVASGYASLDLLPLPNGLLYALAGAAAVSAAIVTFALGVAIRRIDRLAKLMRLLSPSAPGYLVEPAAGTAPAEDGPLRPSPPGRTRSRRSRSRSRRKTRRPPTKSSRPSSSLDGIETALETPEAPPSLIGRYSSGGASYMIFADGSIEAETAEGTFRFASMGEFKRYVAERDGGRAG